ncbi:MAG: LytTR family transcriptional regulator, partial [Bacteroidales bacterium]|nr:LytTR family transcriptional regulator [Bacteroidales bacterium]
GQDVAINPRNFIYVESVGNYANVCYIDKEQLTSTTIRTTIKQLREDLSGNDFIVQCHRGFLVNLDYAESMEGASGRFFLNMFYSDKKIPVSRANKSAIKDALTALRC